MARSSTRRGSSDAADISAGQLSLAEAIEAAISDEELFGRDGACPTLFEAGALARVLVVSGENAGGKSLFCRAISQWARGETDLEIMRVGMGIRTSQGMHRAFMFGEEDAQSTGTISMNACFAGMNTARGRTSPHWLIFDEPDIGLGVGYQRAAGQALAAFAKDLPEQTAAFVVVSHAPDLIAPLVDAGAASVRIGDDIRPVREWIAGGDLVKTIDELEALPERAHLRRRAVQQVLNARSAARQAEREAAGGPRR